MIAINRVRDVRGNTIGFILEDGNFYNKRHIEKYIKHIDNLVVTSSGIIRSKRGRLRDISIKQYNNQIYSRLNKDNPFVRDIQYRLKEWKQSENRMVLQIDGPRQVGKTTEIKKFGYKNYEQVVYINIATDNMFEGLIYEGINPLAMLDYCENKNLPPYKDSRDTLLIIDEIQSSSKVYNNIRGFRENLRCDIVVTGSYLGQVLNREFFQPAGTVITLNMYSLSFREFCRALGIEGKLMGIGLYGEGKSDEYTELFEAYNVYKQIGGYPDIVKTYINTKDTQKCYEKIHQLINLFERESSTYFKDDREVMIFKNVYRGVAQLICNDKRGSGNKTLKELGNIVNKNQKTLVSRDEISRAISWIYYSGIIGACDLFNNGDITDIISGRKIYFRDCGIANYALNMSNFPESNIRGALTENFVYCELYKLYSTGILSGDNPCFSIYGNYELDFVMVDKDRCITGIEVKTKDGSHPSLDYYISKKLIDKGIVAKVTKGGHSDRFDTIPIFAIGCRYPYN